MKTPLLISALFISVFLSAQPKQGQPITMAPASPVAEKPVRVAVDRVTERTIEPNRGYKTGDEKRPAEVHKKEAGYSVHEIERDGLKPVVCANICKDQCYIVMYQMKDTSARYKHFSSLPPALTFVHYLASDPDCVSYNLSFDSGIGARQ